MAPPHSTTPEIQKRRGFRCGRLALPVTDLFLPTFTLLLLLCPLVSPSITPTQPDQPSNSSNDYKFADYAINIPYDSYSHDCSDQHYKDILLCTVHIVDCDTDTEQLVPKVPDLSTAPGEAHDIRIEPFAKALSSSRRLANKDSAVGGTNYQLTVDISWQTPPNNSTRQLLAFLLEIEGENGRKQACFLFNVSQSNWTSQAISLSPRLHFSTDSIFKFAHTYDVTIYSLPETHSRTRSVHKRFSTPHNPVVGNNTGLVSPNCSQYSHPYASKWTAGFRRIFLHSLARTMQVEFVGAPPQYCFEQYEVRLLDETGLELLYSGIVTIEEMKREVINNSTVFFGEFNFTNLELDKSYIPSVIPLERAYDGRCLCPVYGIDPYDNKVVCSCVAADWKPVRLTRLDVVQNDCPNCINSTIPPAIPKPKEGTSQWVLLLLMNIICILVIIAIALAVFFTYRHYQRRGKISRIRFVQDQDNAHRNGGVEHGVLLANGRTPGKVHLENGNVALSQTPLLILNSGSNLNILIVYSHDSKQHEAAVMALAEFLRDVFHMQVGIDCWDGDRIECNMVDYLSSAVVNADKVVVVNSVGAIHRYHCKIAGGDYVVERNSAGTFDHLFLAQIDMVLQHQSIISTRFSNATHDDVLPMLKGCLQYVIPSNLTPLVSALVGRNLKQDPRFTGYNPQLEKLRCLVGEMEEMCRKEPDWFMKTHHRRPAHSERVVKEEDVFIATTTEEMLPVHGDSALTIISSTASTSSVANEKCMMGEEVEVGEPQTPMANRQQSISLQIAQMPQTSVELVQSVEEVDDEEEEEEGVFTESSLVGVSGMPNDFCLDSQPADSGIFDTVDECCTSQPMGECLDETRTTKPRTTDHNWGDEEVEEEEENELVDARLMPVESSKHMVDSRQGDMNEDSGMISDAELRLISAS